MYWNLHGITQSMDTVRNSSMEAAMAMAIDFRAGMNVNESANASENRNEKTIIIHNIFANGSFDIKKNN